MLTLLLFAERLETLMLSLNAFFLRQPVLAILKKLLIPFLNGALLLVKRGLIEVKYWHWIASGSKSSPIKTTSVF